MKQPIKGKGKVKKSTPRKNVKKTPFNVRKRITIQDKGQYGTSQLERDFARDFLDKNNIKYIYQYEAKEIGRFFDFAITTYKNSEYIFEEKDGLKCLKQEGQYVPIDLLIEIDGGYYHSDPRVVDENKLNPMQKHNKFVDKLKDKWAQLHCVTLLRIWEYDIRNHPNKVLEELSKFIEIVDKKRRIIENKKKPH